jgi:class 3 adenylate cyclase/tetratricopeptide (TPR) repeat protein
MRCPSCDAAIPEDARFCPSCGIGIGLSCPSCGTSVADDSRFCPSCGAALQPTAPGQEERKLVSVLFADVTGSTQLGEQLDPERLRDVLATYFAAMREEIEAEGGTVEKFIGDAVMAAFGVPVAHEDDPARAMRAALRMLARLSEVNERLATGHGVTLEVRIGVNTGEVLASTEPKPGEPMVTGDVVNTAARLQTAAEPGGILVADRTARASRGFRYGEPRTTELKGKAMPFIAVPLLSVAEARPARGIPGLSAPMVGRDAEMGLLRDVFLRVAAERRPHLVTVYGDPGVGKSRLTREFLASVSGSDPIVVQGRCLPYGDGITYSPFAEILQQQMGITDTDAPEVVLEKVGGACDVVLTAGSLPPDEACSALAYTLGVEDPRHPMRDKDPRQVRRAMHAAWRSFFSSLAAVRPVVAVVEDIHWADPAMLELLEDLAERVEGPVLFVCPSRPDLVDRHTSWGGGRRNASSIELTPLPAEEADRLVSLLLTVDELPARVHRLILDRAEGNPFFLEEIVGHLIDQGLIVDEQGRWRATRAIDDVQIPDTVQGVLAARIDLLEHDEKRTLQLAAVVGRVFWPAPVGELLNGQAERLADLLESLEQRDLIRSKVGSSIAGEPEFTFKHVLTRDVAYGSLPRRDRSRAHDAVAGWISQRTGGSRWEFQELLAYHYEEAYRGALDDPRAEPNAVEQMRRRALSSLETAAEEARRRYAMDAALALLARALELAGSPLERIAVLEQRGATALGHYRGTLSWDSYREAVDLRLRHAPEDHPGLANACAQAVESPTRWPGSMITIPDPAEVEGYLRIGLDAAGDQEGDALVRLLTSKSFAPFAAPPVGRALSAEEIEAATEAGLRAVEMAERLGSPELVSAALDGLGSVNVSLGRYGDLIAITQRRLALGIDDIWELGDIHAMLAWESCMVGDYVEAKRAAERGIEITEREAEGYTLHCLAWDSVAAFETGDWDRVEANGRRMEQILGERRFPAFTINQVGAMMTVAHVRGAPDEERWRDRLLGLEAEHPGPMSFGKAWLLWLAARERNAEETGPLIAGAREAPQQVARPLFERSYAAFLAEMGRWEEVPRYLDETRAYAAEAGLRALVPAMDALEGRMLMATGDDRGLELLRAAASAFDGLGVRFERARIDLLVAEHLAAAGEVDEASATLATAAPTFDGLHALDEIARARALADRLR